MFMEQMITNIRPYLEALYFLSGVVVAIAALLALKQIRLLKLDMMARSERAAKEKAIEIALIHAKIIDDLYDGVRQMEKSNLPPYYVGPVNSDFIFDSIPENYKKAAQQRYESHILTGHLNMLDGVAASFVSGVADEETAFKIFGNAFCANIASHYDIICASRKRTDSKSYIDLVELYQIWSARLSKKELERARESIDEQIKSIPDKRISPLSPMPPK